jgi:hypothetical protein
MATPDWLAPDTVADLFNRLPTLLNEAIDKRRDNVIATLKQSLLEQMQAEVQSASSDNEPNLNKGGIYVAEATLWDEDYDYMASTWTEQKMREELGFREDDGVLVTCWVKKKAVMEYIRHNEMMVTLTRTGGK